MYPEIIGVILHSFLPIMVTSLQQPLLSVPKVAVVPLYNVKTGIFPDGEKRKIMVKAEYKDSNRLWGLSLRSTAYFALIFSKNNQQKIEKCLPSYN